MPPSPPPPAMRASFLPRLFRLPVISWSVYCGGPLAKQLNDSVKYTDSLVWRLMLSLAAHFQICQHVNALKLRLPPSAQANYWSHEGGPCRKSSVRCSSIWIIHSGWRNACFLDFLGMPTAKMALDWLNVLCRLMVEVVHLTGQLMIIFLINQSDYSLLIHSSFPKVQQL